MAPHVAAVNEELAMPNSASRVQLLRIFGVMFGVAVVVGGMVGQGILRTPGIVAGAVHSPQLILLFWAAGAALAAISAFAYVELGTAIPLAGGPYDFVRRGFGPLAGVVAGFAVWLISITTMAFLAIVAAEFLHRLAVWPSVSTSGIAVGILALFWAVNWTGTRISGGSQIVFSAFKAAALAALVVLLLAQPPVAQPPVADLTGPVGLAAIAIAMRAIVNTYGGWEDVVHFGEEMHKPERTLPRSMMVGIVSVALLYLLVNLALLHVIAPAEIAHSKLPAADAARVALGSFGDSAFTVFGIVSVAAITNLKIMKSARISFALARSGQLPVQLSHVASTGTPRAALTVSTLLGAAFAATGTYETVVAANVGLTITLAAIVNLTAMRLRRTEPDLARPFRVPLYPIPILIAIVVNVGLLGAFILEDPLHSLQGLGLLAVLAIVYSLIHRTRDRAEAPAA
jgi:APA family basic amino acid/polyamine antiporter